MTTPAWAKLQPINARPNPCLNCPPITATLHMERTIAVGFGDAHVERDGEEVYREPGMRDLMADCQDCGSTGEAAPGVVCGQCGGLGSIEDRSQPQPEYWSVVDAEKAAAADPDHDWRIVLFGPLHGEEYQRQGVAEWVLVKSNQGFA